MFQESDFHKSSDHRIVLESEPRSCDGLVWSMINNDRGLNLLRSILFVPADSPAKLASARKAPADVLLLDWEDAVLPEKKPLARKLAQDYFKEYTGSGRIVLVRVNPVGSPAFEDDCASLMEFLPDGIVLSKCQSAEDVIALEGVLGSKDLEERCHLYPLIESSLGIVNANSIVRSSSRVHALAFGAEDFCAEAGIVRTSEEIELLYARSALVTATRAAGRNAWDSPCVELGDETKVRASARRARNLGFSGKFAIHPSQVAAINEVFSPSESEIREAHRVLAAFDSNGRGATAIDGIMVDEARLRRARRTLQVAEEVEQQRQRS